MNWIFNSKAQLDLSLMAPVKGKGLELSTITLGKNPVLAAAIWQLFQEPESVNELDSGLLVQLQDLGLVLQAEQAPAEIYWQCPLPGDDDLLPYAERLPAPPSELIVNPTLAWQTDAGPPPELRGRIHQANKLDLQAPLIWLDDPGTRILMAYHPDATQLRLIALLQRRLNPAGLDPTLRQRLYWSGVLVEPDYLETRYRVWQQQLAIARTTMAEQGYAVLRQLLNPLQQAAMRRYFRLLATQGYFRDGDAQVRLRHSIYNEGMARFLHHQLNYLVNQVTPEAVIPSYCYLSIYQPGAVLRRHRDRRQCAWNMSLVLDMEPEQAQAQAWPIYLELPEGIREVRLEMGDAVLYRGHEIEHWRDALPENQRLTACFFHFVDENFDERLD